MIYTFLCGLIEGAILALIFLLIVFATSILHGTFANTAYFFLITFAQQGKRGYLMEDDVEERTYP